MKQAPAGEPAGVNHIKLQILGGGNLDAGARGGSDGAGTDILARCCGGLSLDRCGYLSAFNKFYGREFKFELYVIFRSCINALDKASMSTSVGAA